MFVSYDTMTKPIANVHRIPTSDEPRKPLNSIILEAHQILTKLELELEPSNILINETMQNEIEDYKVFEFWCVLKKTSRTLRKVIKRNKRKD